MTNDNNKIVLTNEYFMDIVKFINTATTIEGLLEGFPSLMNVRTAIYHHFAAVGAFDFKSLNRYYAYNVPQSLLDHYDTHNKHKAYPGIAATFSNGEFLWLSDMVHHPFVTQVGHEVFLGEMVSLSGDGLCIPLYGPNNRDGYLFIAFDQHKTKCSSIMGFQVQALAQKFHIRYCLMVEKRQDQVKLTPREAEVLEFITFGKTNTDIGQILNISTHTVAGYVRKIFLKLDVSDRVSAAMRAQSIKIDI